MNHLSEEQVMQVYYGELAPKLRKHLKECPECRANFERLRDALDSVREYPVPERGASYGGEVWTRLLPHLPARETAGVVVAVVDVTPALASSACRCIHRRDADATAAPSDGDFGESAGTRAADGDERSPGAIANCVDGTGQCERPGSWISRTSAGARANYWTKIACFARRPLTPGIRPRRRLLDELERVLLDIANSPPNMPPGDLETLQQPHRERGPFIQGARYKHGRS